MNRTDSDLEKGRKAFSLSRLKRRLILTLVFCIFLAALLGWVWFAGRSQASRSAEEEIARLNAYIQELVETPVVVTPVSPEINLATIYSDIQAISELSTVEYLFTDAARFTDSKQFRDWNIPFTEKSFMLKWDGSIKAGIDLSSVTLQVSEEDKTITVSMPSAAILSYEIDNDSVEVLDEQNNLFNNITINDKIKFDAATEEAMKERAVENGILEKAQKNAQDILLRLLTSYPAIGDGYTITFAQT